MFTDPITGVDLNMDRSTYRPTAAQREWLRRRNPDCGCPTCSIRIDASDLDHITDWQFDGLTNENNLVPLSRGHHTLKHRTKITVTRTAQGRTVWRTPTGFERESDPPPF
ncbi:MAG: HNH endonuclease [Microbacteriaceae bacterium]|nr:MAG: HNH endonuclease [Microbacteriaceae bacterium]